MNYVEKSWKMIVALWTKTYIYLINDSSEDEKGEGTKKVCYKNKF